MMLADPTVAPHQFEGAALPPATPCGLPMEDIVEVAEHVAEHLRFKPGDSIKQLIVSLQGTIVYEELEETLGRGKRGSIIVRGPGDFTIFLSKYENDLRNRFTMAHELGHYILHSLCGEKPLCQGRYGNSLVEWESNWFAAAFLLPTKGLKSFGIKRPIADIAEAFRVTVTTAETRLAALRE